MIRPITISATPAKIISFKVSSALNVAIVCPKTIGSLEIIPTKIKNDTPLLNAYSVIKSPSQTASMVPAVIVKQRKTSCIRLKLPMMF